jgi:hypothetical protein
VKLSPSNGYAMGLQSRAILLDSKEIVCSSRKRIEKIAKVFSVAFLRLETKTGTIYRETHGTTAWQLVLIPITKKTEQKISRLCA